VRRTIQERLAANEAERLVLLSKADGTFVSDVEQTVEKQIRARLRKCGTELRAAFLTVNGAVADGDKKARASIADRIKGTLRRLETQRETETRAYGFLESLPGDIEVLEALVVAMDAGVEDIEFPEGLTRLSKPEDRSDEEHEVQHIAASEVMEANAGDLS
jgi:hypothetical protein